MGSISRLLLIFGRAQSPRRRTFHYQDIGLNWALIVLMQFFTRLIFLDRPLELILLICFVRCGKARASPNLADNCLFGWSSKHVRGWRVHRLQLVIEDAAILSQGAIIDLLAKYRRLATHFNHSTLACNEVKILQEEQDKTPLFNSTGCSDQME